MWFETIWNAIQNGNAKMRTSEEWQTELEKIQTTGVPSLVKVGTAINMGDKIKKLGVMKGTVLDQLYAGSNVVQGPALVGLGLP